MSEIPEGIPRDIWEAALEPAEVTFDASVDLYETGVAGADVRLVIARAILAERERCVAVCLAEAKAFLSPEYASNQPLGSLCERFACEQCASAIRNPLPTENSIMGMRLVADPSPPADTARIVNPDGSIAAEIVNIKPSTD